MSKTDPSITNLANAKSMPVKRACIVTVTYYTDTSDIRFLLAQQLCRSAYQQSVQVIIVDGSPPQIQTLLMKEQNDYVQIFRQSKEQQGKGGALRQAIDHATKWFIENKADLKRCAICFTEPEKLNLLNHIDRIVEPLLSEEMDVVVPFRNEKLFRETYPIEQYHSESFANLHFNSLAKRHDGFKGMNIDWLFGPFAFNASLALYWMQYTGKSWDAQMIPYVRGIRDHRWRVQSVNVDFVHPTEMKKQEEGDPAWSNKRLHQLNLLFELLGIFPVDP